MTVFLLDNYGFKVAEESDFFSLFLILAILHHQSETNVLRVSLLANAKVHIHSNENFARYVVKQLP